jgi:LPS sulfotransferase NodH
MNADLEKLRQQIRDKAADACFNTQQALDIAHLSMAIVSPEIARLKARIAELEKDSATLDAFRAEVIAERDAETIAWLGKKAREYRSTGRKQDALQADAIDTMASKLKRGAVRANNLLGVVTRPDVLNEAADLIEAEQHRLDDAENARHGCLDHESELQHVAVHAMGALLRRVAEGSEPRG